LLSLTTGGLSLLLARAGNAVFNAKFTQAYGQSVARFFLQSGIRHEEFVVRDPLFCRR